MVHTRGRGSKNKNKREMMLVFLVMGGVLWIGIAWGCSGSNP